MDRTRRRDIAIAAPDIGEDEWQALREPILSGWLSQGPQVEAFEQSFCERSRVKYAVATTSGTTALHLALAVSGMGPGDEVIVPAFTWVATASAVLYCGATPVFVDVDPFTMNIDVDQVSRRITARTRAIIAVHLFGLCADMDRLAGVAGDVPLIEDAACSAGATYKGRPSGSLGVVGAFSFHPRKVMTTGEGGMLTTNDDRLAEMARMMRNHGARSAADSRHGGTSDLTEFSLLGFNYRMTDLQAALGRVQLGKLDRMIRERAILAGYYQEHLAAVPWLRVPKPAGGYGHSWQAYVCRIDASRAPMSRDEIMARLEGLGIRSRPGTHAVHMLEYYRERMNLEEDEFPVARDLHLHSLALPLHNRMSEEDCEYVVESILGLG